MSRLAAGVYLLLSHNILNNLLTPTRRLASAARCPDTLAFSLLLTVTNLYKLPLTSLMDELIDLP